MFGFHALDYYIITWNFVFYLIFLTALPYIFLKLFLTFYIETTNNSINLAYSRLINQALASLIVILFILITLWSSPELFLFNNQLFINEKTFVSYKFIVPTILILIFFQNINVKYTLLYFILLLTAFFTVSLMPATRSFYTLLFILEFVNLTIFGLLTLTLLPTFFKTQLNTHKTLNAVFLFFWINAFSALILFIFLFVAIIDNAEFGFNTTALTYYFEINKSLHPHLLIGALGDAITMVVLDSTLFVFLLFFLIFMFKLGLPPFIFWKISLFNNSPLRFIFIYTAFYTPVIVFIFLYIFDNFFTSLMSNELIYSAALATLTLTIFGTILLSESVKTLGIFFALSSSYTFILLYFYFFINSHVYSNLTGTPSIYFEFIKVYIVFYVAALSLIVNTTDPKLEILGKKPTTYLSQISGFMSATFSIRLAMSVIFFSLAGLPPLPSFFVKLNFLTLLNSALLTNTINFIILYVFIFGQLIFYFRIVRFFFTTTDSLNTTISKKPKLNTKHILEQSNSLLLFTLTGSVFALNDIILFSFI